jgi:alginate O-acetyltransferase complex protein AlgJ
MKTLLRNSILFAAPFLLFLGIELFVLPIDAFTFRVWEAATISGNFLKGAFLPFLHIEKIESGDRRLPNGPTKRVEWFTDGFGYRNRLRPIARFDVVAIGDSNIVGTFLDQPNTFAETLERSCGCTVYNHAYSGPGDFLNYLRQERFAKFPPKLVFYDFRDYDLYDEARFPPIPDLPADQGNISSEPQWKTEMAILGVRYNKHTALNWAKARLHLAITRFPYSNLAPRAKLKSATELIEENGDKFAGVMADYKKYLEARGSHFVVFVIDTDYKLADRIRPLLERAGVDVLTFPRVADPRAAYFQDWDSHWREEGVAAAASVVAAYIRDKKILESAGN